jgi:hypothetical protein
MDSTLLFIAGAAAIVTVLAFLGVLATLSARAGQESRLRTFLEEREGFAGRLLQVRKGRVEKLKALNAKAAARIAGLPEPEIPGVPVPGPGSTGIPDQDPAAAESNRAEIAKQAKENPAEAASIIKTYFLPKIGA